jgi:hypothetical protein
MQGQERELYLAWRQETSQNKTPEGNDRAVLAAKMSVWLPGFRKICLLLYFVTLIVHFLDAASKKIGTH